MAGVLERTSNSVIVNIKSTSDYINWQTTTLGGSVTFAWRVLLNQSLGKWEYYIRFSKIIPSEKMNYIVKYTHWEILNAGDTAVMSIRSDLFGAVLCLGNLNVNNTRKVAVEISTAPSSPCVIIYNDTEMTDFKLRGEDGSVPFHKVVLAAHSSVFKTMLAGNWKETSEGFIDVPGTSIELLQHLKKYMYLGILPEKQNKQVECLQQLLLLSSCYLIQDLKLRCLKELRFLLTKENVSDILQFAMDNKVKLLHLEIIDCTAMGDLDLYEVRKLVEAEDATLLPCDKP